MRYGDAEALRQTPERREGHVRFAALNGADEGPMETARHSQAFLRKSL
jgi:hypothetical protein